MGHNKRQQCVEFVQTKDELRNWKDIRIMIFDAPQSTDKPYSQRLELLKQSKSIQLNQFDSQQTFHKIIPS
jgi:hypothetical protein